MGTSNYSDAFNRDAVQQITVRGYLVREVAGRLAVSSHSLYEWLKLFGEPVSKSVGAARRGRQQTAEARVGARDRGARYPKKGFAMDRHWFKGHGERVLRARVTVEYVVIRAHRAEYGVRARCRVLRVHVSGFYAWLKELLSRRAHDDARQTQLVRQAWSDSGKVYGHRKLTDDLCDQGETCLENRVARLASLAASWPRSAKSAA